MKYTSLLYKTLLVLFFAGGIHLPLRAQDTSPESSLPDSVVITASRYAEDVRLTGRRLTVITARDIAGQPVSSVDELLRTVGGVEIKSRGGFGVQSDFNMRGSTFNGVLVLIDGARFNDPMTGHFVSDFPIPLSDIARIEILRGPATALYGPDAIGGVVQIFTYAGLRSNDRPLPGGARGTAQIGRYGMYGADVTANGSWKATGWSAAAALQGSDGMPITDATGNIRQGRDGELRTDFSRQAYTAALTGRLSGATWYTRFGLDDRDFGAWHFYTPFASDTARETTTTYWAQARLARPSAGNTSWEVQLAAKQHEDAYTYNPVTPANHHTSRLLSLHTQGTHRFRENLSVSAGTLTGVRTIDSNNLGEHQDVSGGVFTMARWQPWARLTLNGSGRADYDRAYGLELTPQLSAAYNTDLLTFRAGLSRAVREPNYVERYINTTLRSPRGRDLGNPDLKAETAWAYEAGFDVFPTSGLALHATAFLRDTDNLIDYAKLTPADTVFLARNILSVRAQGVEVDLEYDVTIGPARLKLVSSATWLDVDLGDYAEDMSFKYALTNASRLHQTAATVNIGPVMLGTQHIWKKQLDDRSYGLLNARAGYGFYLGQERVTLTGEVRNLTDVAYTEVFDAPMPGRWWLFGLQFAL